MYACEYVCWHVGGWSFVFKRPEADDSSSSIAVYLIYWAGFLTWARAHWLGLVYLATFSRDPLSLSWPGITGGSPCLLDIQILVLTVTCRASSQVLVCVIFSRAPSWFLTYTPRCWSYCAYVVPETEGLPGKLSKLSYIRGPGQRQGPLWWLLFGFVSWMLKIICLNWCCFLVEHQDL